MPNIDDIKATAQLVWPDAEHIDIAPGSSSLGGAGDPNPQGFRLIATHADGSIMGQEFADDLEELEAKLKAKL